MSSAVRRSSSTVPVLAGRNPASEPAIASGKAGRPGVLLVASLFKLPYRVLRCATAAGAEVHVLAGRGARGLRLSRYCRQWVPSRCPIDGSQNEALAVEIDRLARELGIAMVLPGDAPATRSVIACREQLTTPTFALPPLETFDLLNDKWEFTQLCGRLGMRHPASCRFDGPAGLSEAIAAGKIGFPSVAKPLSMSGGEGFVRLGARSPQRRNRIDYRPIIVQEFVAGEDVSASIFARQGEITAFVAYRHGRGVYTTFWSDLIFADLRRLARHLMLDGLYNFDMRQSGDGRIHYLECNPRVFFTIDSALIAGINFLACGLPGSASSAGALIRDEIAIHRPKAIATAPRHWPHLTGKDLAMAVHLYADPVPHLLEGARILA